MSTTSNVLSAPWLAGIIAQSIPPSASPQLKTPYDAVAIAVHAALIAVGFRLIGLSEDERLPPCPSDTVPELPESWNIQSPANFSFVYAHSQSAMEYLVKINRMGGKAVVMGMGVGDDKNISFDIKIDEYISASSLPATPVTSSNRPSRPEATAEPASSAAQVEVPQPLRQAILDIFISAGRLSDFAALTRQKLIQKLLPSLHKEGYEESSTTRTSNREDSTSTPRPSRPAPDEQPARAPHPLHDPLRMPPRRPQVPTGDFPPPGFDDEYDLTRPPRPLGGPPGGIGGGYGHRDLYPAGLGPNDPFRGIGPGLQGGGGGMHPTFDDPLFGGQGQGGDGFDPQAPYGARYDPVGPGGAPRGNGGGGFPGRGGFGGPRNPFGGFGGGDFI
ncbi:hypothetical protein K461DRAFT_282413 [Myriangium duriaei CBS 260.36]|uniref:Proteasome inhibitor PI31 subunit n=1 Tax=Myriangium duriaei CBS 260.36 TaxID=1168546 RepID=A0A9P4IY85_9PEZI|nr:hypothetical protein K461DRAFT_282413 [Myriangium duriaei CBS 260.36]